ncbi:MAG TPA: flagellar basal body rod protein FlgC [Candidatus Krumholzibacteria bacterium]|nr:flagellar basal body rod protein FlgC [Candidatus Krumholzibacteria bacterium]HPD71632.1 flagellar basal body rod protein FlgC [Candidatus Krumholzibacteria bacterium]HRY41435.1 flagellar basal body rod protein FlgC [Candidatus Krumholzibacteria bacterium]
MSKGLFEAIRISGSGLSGQRVKMDVVARNLANAETTRTEDGTPYRRERAVFREILERRVQAQRERLDPANDEFANGPTRTHPNHLPGLTALQLADREGVRTEAEVAPDASEFRVIYDPGHPDADEDGYVLMPNVDVVTEMVDLITASRAYEANISAVQAAKDMFNQALKI